jgi:predicted transposase YbfD/YdcC
LGLPLWQQAVADKTNEIPILEEVLHGLELEGRVITMDALLPQRAIAHRMVESGGDYIMLVKGNKAQLHHDIVFNIGGNKYRLITAIHFNRRKVYIRSVLTRHDYARGAWKT